MASASVTLTVRVRDMDRTRLFVWQLHELRSRMTVAADPFAMELDQAISRYVDGGDDEERTMQNYTTWMDEKESPGTGVPMEGIEVPVDGSTAEISQEGDTEAAPLEPAPEPEPEDEGETQEDADTTDEPEKQDQQVG